MDNTPTENKSIKMFQLLPFVANYLLLLQKIIKNIL